MAIFETKNFPTDSYIRKVPFEIAASSPSLVMAHRAASSSPRAASSSPRERRRPRPQVPRCEIAKFTLVQLALLGTLYLVKSTAIGISFPLFIAVPCPPPPLTIPSPPRLASSP